MRVFLQTPKPTLLEEQLIIIPDLDSVERVFMLLGIQNKGVVLIANRART